MDKFLETYSLPRPNQEEIENLNRPLTSKDIEFVTIKSQERKSHGQIASVLYFTKI